MSGDELPARFPLSFDGADHEECFYLRLCLDQSVFLIIEGA